MSSGSVTQINVNNLNDPGRVREKTRVFEEQATYNHILQSAHFPLLWLAFSLLYRTHSFMEKIQCGGIYEHQLCVKN